MPQGMLCSRTRLGADLLHRRAYADLNAHAPARWNGQVEISQGAVVPHRAHAASPPHSLSFPFGQRRFAGRVQASDFSTRLNRYSSRPYYSAGEKDEGEEIGGSPVKTGCDTAKMFELIEAAFDSLGA
jgi:hypothetical protein